MSGEKNIFSTSSSRTFALVKCKFGGMFIAVCACDENDFKIENLCGMHDFRLGAEPRANLERRFIFVAISSPLRL